MVHMGKVIIMIQFSIYSFKHNIKIHITIDSYDIWVAIEHRPLVPFADSYLICIGHKDGIPGLGAPN